jgi:signal transduction histidine kinase/ActR/RegA family two-component response regulator
LVKGNNGKLARKPVLNAASDVRLGELAPLSDWRGVEESEHFVQFYETDKFLLDSLSGFIGAGLREGEGCIVLATGEHLTELEDRLTVDGLDLKAAGESGQYVSLEASGALSLFMIDGLPEPRRFDEFVSALLSRAIEGRHRVRIFGEMVMLLWSEGNQEAAFRLEELWNELHRVRPFKLFCAYPLNGFDTAGHAESLHGVCSTHSRVIPAESYTALISPDDRLRAIIKLQQQARLLQQKLEEREQLLAREQLARAEAESANRLKDEFLATASHELRTPLTAIIGWSHMLQENKPDEATLAHGLETIERNAKAQAQLVEDILDVSRVITGKLRLSVGSVDLASVINAAIDAVQLAADSRYIQLAVTLDPSARHTSGDAGRLQQVIWNLLSNAIKFTPTGGRIEVRLERATDRQAQISVTDTGEGIAPAFLPFIFDRFRQADSSSTRRHGGLGLGLALVRHLVELHGGTVRADSPGLGQGSTFTILLPLTTPAERPQGRPTEVERSSAKRAESRPEHLSSLDGVRVLLVDDDRDTLNMLKVILSEYGATLHTASTAAEALEVLRWYEPDVLVSDLAMPGEDGYSLINKVRALEAAGSRQIPALALTAYVRVEDRARALSAGFNMFIPKPVEPAELITSILSLVAPVTTSRLKPQPQRER